MLRDEIRAAINRNSAEGGSDTPDFILAEYLEACLTAFDAAVRRRETWYGRDDSYDEHVTLLTGGEREQVAEA